MLFVNSISNGCGVKWIPLFFSITSTTTYDFEEMYIAPMSLTDI